MRIRTATFGVVAAALTFAPSTTVRAGTGTAVIAGRLLTEWPRPDGPTPPAVAGATIEVVATTWCAVGLPPLDERPAPALATTTSGPDGSFRVEGLPAGRLGLVVRAPTIATTLIDGFRVAQGATYRGYDLVCRDKPVEFSSRLVRRDGGPVGDLEIVAWNGRADREPLFGRREVVRTKTAADGSFKLTGTVDHPSTVVRIGTSYIDLDRQVRRGWGDPKNPPPKTIEIGGPATLDVVATDAAGKPVAGARVRVLADGLHEAKTSADGRCSFPSLEDGGFVLVADAPGLASGLIAGVESSPVLFGDAPKPDPKFKPLVAGKNERTVVLEKTCSLTGTVAGFGDDQPVAGARVRYATAMSMIFGAPETSTDAAGRFKFDGLPRGGGVVVVDKEGRRQNSIGRDEPWDFLQKSVRGEVRAGGPVQGPTVFFAAPGAAADGKFVVQRDAPLVLEVCDMSKKPVPGAHVVYLSESDKGGVSIDHRFHFSGFLPQWNAGFADENGRMTLDVEPAGGKLFVDAPTFPQIQALVAPEASRPAGPKSVVMERHALVDFRVVDAAGRPIAGAFVWSQGLRDPGRIERQNLPDDELVGYLRHNEPSIADAAGKVRAQYLWDGPVLVVVGRPGLLGTTATRMIVSEGGPRTYDVKLTPKAAVVGRVTRGGEAAQGAHVRAFHEPPKPKDGGPGELESADVEVAPDGSFRIDCVAACRVAVVAYVPSKTDPDRAQAKAPTVEIDVKAGAPTELPAAIDIPAPK